MNPITEILLHIVPYYSYLTIEERASLFAIIAKHPELLGDDKILYHYFTNDYFYKDVLTGTNQPMIALLFDWAFLYLFEYNFSAANPNNFFDRFSITNFLPTMFSKNISEFSLISTSTEGFVLLSIPEYGSYSSVAIDGIFTDYWYTVDLFLFLPEIFFFFSLLILFCSVLLLNVWSKTYFLLNMFTIVSFLLLYIYLNNFTIDFDVFYNSLTSNFYIYNCKMFILILSLIFMVLIKAYITLDKQLSTYEFIYIYSLVIFSLIILMGVNDFLGLFLSLELQSLSLYVLAAYKTTSSFSTEAGIKYFILGAIASGMLLFGFSIIYGVTGTINFTDLNVFNFFFSFNYNSISLPNNPLEAPTPLYNWALMDSFIMVLHNAYFIGFVFFAVGLFFKLGIAPFHMWLPDVYEGSPLITTAFFALIPKIGLIFLFIRLCSLHFFFDTQNWSFIFLCCGILSIFIGTFGALFQTKIKRLFAYSAINHMGFLLVSLINFNTFSYMIAFSYGIAYVILNLSFFSILITLRKIDGTPVTDIRELSSLSKNNKLLAILFSLNLFSISGIPPLFGFYSKWLVLMSLVNSNWWFASFVILILSMISVFYYLKLVKILFFDLTDNYTQFIVPSRALAYVIVILSIFNIFFMLFANLFFSEILNIIFFLI